MNRLRYLKIYTRYISIYLKIYARRPIYGFWFYNNLSMIPTTETNFRSTGRLKIFFWFDDIFHLPWYFCLLFGRLSFESWVSSPWFIMMYSVFECVCSCRMRAIFVLIGFLQFSWQTFLIKKRFPQTFSSFTKCD